MYPFLLRAPRTFVYVSVQPADTSVCSSCGTARRFFFFFYLHTPVEPTPRSKYRTFPHPRRLPGASSPSPPCPRDVHDGPLSLHRPLWNVSLCAWLLLFTMKSTDFPQAITRGTSFLCSLPRSVRYPQSPTAIQWEEEHFQHIVQA